MAQRMKKAWIWTKLSFILLVIVWVVLFLAFNWKEEVEVWLIFWVSFDRVPLTVVLLVTAIASVAVFWVIRKVAGVIHEYTEVRDKDKSLQREKKMEELAKRVESKAPADGAGPPKNQSAK
jgi:uncharacterized integral membrane protein